MNRTAQVVTVNGKLMARITRTDVCQRCGACQHGHEEERLYPLPKGDFAEGDTVEITLPDSGALVGSLIAYGIPVACLIAGLVIANALHLPDLAQIAVALAFLAASFFAIRALEPRIRKSGRFTPSYRCPENIDGGQDNGT